MFGEILDRVRKTGPLVHCITNYVIANDCANVILACGARPVMADDPAEAAEITSLADGLVINLGTPGRRRFEAMLIAGQTANRRGIPVILDPVGVWASSLRTEIADELLEKVRFTAIRGNSKEICHLAGCASDHVQAARLLSERTGAVVIVTGAQDIVTNNCGRYKIFNGHSAMKMVTGTGCMLTAVIASFCAAAPEYPLISSVAATAAMSLAGEIAVARMAPPDGIGSLRTYIIDALSRLTPEVLEEGSKYEVE